jgi:hypothetical protein
MPGANLAALVAGGVGPAFPAAGVAVSGSGSRSPEAARAPAERGRPAA